MSSSILSALRKMRSEAQRRGGQAASEDDPPPSAENANGNPMSAGGVTITITSGRSDNDAGTPNPRDLEEDDERQNSWGERGYGRRGPGRKPTK